MNKKTHFGYQEVPVEEKVKRVAGVFHSVANKYDIMNDLMSFGVHRLWKRYTLALSGVRAGHSVLDLAGGTGDLAMKFCKRVGESGRVVLSDINASMLMAGRTRLIDHGLINNIEYVQANAEALPFQDNSFDCVTIAFGLRNVTDQNAALRSIYRVLKPGGRLLVLEFSRPVSSLLGKAYDFYSFNVIPQLGELVTGDRDSYQYLVESIRKHPDQETLKGMMHDAGYGRCDYHNLTGGVVALHRGYKI